MNKHTNLYVQKYFSQKQAGAANLELYAVNCSCQRDKRRSGKQKQKPLCNLRLYACAYQALIYTLKM